MTTACSLHRCRSHLLSLLRPAGTVMDLNIGAALWLAVAGQGSLRLPSPAPPTPHPASRPAPAPAHVTRNSIGQAKSPATEAAGGETAVPDGEDLPFYGSAARVVFLGHGADEQCGGYGRHRTKYREGGTAGLASELEVDVRRLWLRNLGRDDRLVSDWGREARHPFLDEHVMGLLLHMRLRDIAGEGQRGRADGCEAFGGYCWRPTARVTRWWSVNAPVVPTETMAGDCAMSLPAEQVAPAVTVCPTCLFPRLGAAPGPWRQGGAPPRAGAAGPDTCRVPRQARHPVRQPHRQAVQRGAVWQQQGGQQGQRGERGTAGGARGVGAGRWERRSVEVFGTW